MRSFIFLSDDLPENECRLYLYKGGEEEKKEEEEEREERRKIFLPLREK